MAIASSQRAVRVPRKRIGELVGFVARAEGARIAAVDVAVVTAAEIAALNRRYLRHAGPTDVLSFDLSDADRAGLSAQIVVCGELAAAEARTRGIGPQRELLLYVVHGLLHLIGYEDDSVLGAARMRARQEELLDEFLAGAAARRAGPRRPRPRKR